MKKTLLQLFILVAPLFSFAQNENALYFDNVDDYVSVPGASSLIAGDDSISLSFWVYPENAAATSSDYDGFAGFRNNTDADFYLLQLSSTDVEARFRNSAGTTYDIIFTGLILNTWQHFTMTYDGTTLTLYHNDVVVGSQAASGTISITTDPFYIGMTPWPGDNFYLSGKLDDVSLWSKTLTASEINCLYTGAADPTQAGLELYYRFNQGIPGGNNLSINTLTDATGSINGVLNTFALNGATSNWVGGTPASNSSTITDVICPGSTYIFGSQTLTAPGTYFEAIPVAGGCDSIVQLVLTPATINTTISQTGPVLTSLQAGAVYQWIDCGNGNTPIAGATAQQYTATANGQYAVIISLGGCSDTTVCATVTNVGLNDLQTPFLSASPNPFHENVKLLIPQTFINKQVIVYDVAGREVFKSLITGELMQLPSASWNSAVYYVSIEGYSSRLKLIKQ